MYSTLVELMGLACLVAAAAVLGGLAPALLVAGPTLLFVGASTDDAALGSNIRRVGALPIRAVGRMRATFSRQLLLERLLGE